MIFQVNFRQTTILYDNTTDYLFNRQPRILFYRTYALYAYKKHITNCTSVHAYPIYFLMVRVELALSQYKTIYITIHQIYALNIFDRSTSILLQTFFLFEITKEILRAIRTIVTWLRYWTHHSSALESCCFCLFAFSF